MWFCKITFYRNFKTECKILIQDLVVDSVFVSVEMLEYLKEIGYADNL